MYAEVVHSKSKFGLDTQVLYGSPSAYAEMKLLKEFYEECGIETSKLTFLETHGTGTLVNVISSK